MTKQPVSVCWFRRDLRLDDNAALYHALRGKYPVLPLFIFDKNILDHLENKSDPRVRFIHDTVSAMLASLASVGSVMEIAYGKPKEVWKTLLLQYDIRAVYANEDYEDYAIQRDAEIAALLKKQGTTFQLFKDHVILDKTEVLKDDGTPYTVYTPYAKKWKAMLTDFHLKPYPTKKYFSNLVKSKGGKMPELNELGFEQTTDNGHRTTNNFSIPSDKIDHNLIRNYGKTRDYPFLEDGTSRLGLHLRFGTISIRKLAKQAQKLSDVYFGELIWRDFYSMILPSFPHVGKSKAFKPAYDNINWRNNEKEFDAWCAGQTGYPIVDAGMRQLNETGFMHNRVRMITASFLTKHLLIDWRWGEAYFAEKLLDYELASNNGGWQWAAGSGNDAAPYFRIFNPELQMKRFDKNLAYVRKWVPEFGSPEYPQPIVDHKFARERCLRVYKEALNNT